MADDPDELAWLVYSSFAADEFDDERLRALLEQSRRDNARRDVTGLLLFKDQRFLQALEGPRDVVDTLMATIEQDPRHIDVYVLLEEPLAERRFPSWAMGYRAWSDAGRPWPTDNVDAFWSLTNGDASDDVRASLGELFAWFASDDHDEAGAEGYSSAPPPVSSDGEASR